MVPDKVPNDVGQSVLLLDMYEMTASREDRQVGRRNACRELFGQVLGCAEVLVTHTTSVGFIVPRDYILAVRVCARGPVNPSVHAYAPQLFGAGVYQSIARLVPIPSIAGH